MSTEIVAVTTATRVAAAFASAIMGLYARYPIAAGIGLFIAFIGLQYAGLIVKDPGTAVRLNPRF